MKTIKHIIISVLLFTTLFLTSCTFTGEASSNGKIKLYVTIENNEVVFDKECFDVANRERNLLKSAYLKAVNSYMCNVLVVDEHTIIYIGEVLYGASEKYILRK
jgi:hypothetical protein